jgi:RNA polymerase sigma-70 factor (ECF subfamily)
MDEQGVHPTAGEAAAPPEQVLFMALLAPVEKKLYNFLLKTARYAEEGSDLFQEVLLRAFRYFSSYDRGRSFSAWIFAIAHNEIKLFYKNRVRREAQVSLSALPADPPAAAPVSDAGLIYEAAGRLPVKEREVFFLYYYNEFSVAEIASITGQSAGNVKFILFKARAMVRDVLEVNNEAR